MFVLQDRETFPVKFVLSIKKNALNVFGITYILSLR